jgi:predicted DNA-binding antitoxin AbrB/MazE fold protein
MEGSFKGDELMSGSQLTVEAVYENGVLRPLRPLPLRPQQLVTITLQMPGTAIAWPDDVAAIYQELAAEDRRLAEAMLPAVRETWPGSEERS